MMSHTYRQTWILSVVAILMGMHRAEAADMSLPIKVLQPRWLPGDPISAIRTPLGIPNDYKPWIVQCKNGELLIVAFCYGGKPYSERAVFWRSRDGGKTWEPREERKEIHGREFSLNCLSDGTLLMPCHFLKQDAYNHAGHTYSKLFRSTDHGKTWSETRIGPEGFPPNAVTATDWTVLELTDPEAPNEMLAMLGVSMQHGRKQAPSTVALWRSRDSGKTWDKTLKPDTDGWIDVDGFFSQSTTYRAKSGRLLHVVRVDATGPHWKVPDLKFIKKESGDQADRMMLWESTDNGKSWQRHGKYGTFGAGGEMYPRFLRLRDGRLLLTFTVRSSSTDGHALGLRAIISHDDGLTWDFDHDRLVISYVNHGASGGGFGNTIQLADDSLVSVYSYRGEDAQTHVEAVRWKLPAASGKAR